jgi:four helix bundle protein
MRPHERLDVWKISIELVSDVYRLAKSFSKEELFGLSAQMRRAAVSVPSNIAEGCARKGKKE